MLIPKKNRNAVYSFILSSGVIVVKKDTHAKKHLQLDVPNLEVMKICQSLTSRGYLKEQFSWGYFYYILTDNGIDYLRRYLNLPVEIVPETLKKPTRPPGVRPSSFPQEGQEKRLAPGRGDFRPEFRGGFGRGKGEYRIGESGQ
ncbi:40S ribosomal protein S10-B [Galdieria sulphuraria]|uniref:40S ribosomal protein S1e n=1 Tax=Galdieria sulphuraria TaxID=130081 RepID=M2XAT5_GALSU|nr:40S ribosomal protein S1e [Galdieria sulphuraria]EME27002.1 40S ribosomal protein S1e [Galdieria sulphuraria]GJD10987.1 40S ribosomal protein S10-B [Galdieria sulphuraria]|eukprot:XP_005703522.1 40S ribosomal protein S1e [Galdieria sulphuraria]